MEQSQPAVVATPVYVPLTQYQPIFAEVEPVKTDLPIPPDVMGILQAAEVLSIRQHVKLLPKTCCACPPCVKQENTYSVYAGMNRDVEAEFLRIDEVSTCDGCLLFCLYLNFYSCMSVLKEVCMHACMRAK